ncbi:MAG: MJ0042-type zinc finger domain-containing protein [Pseudomonadota bacterium]
MPITCPKCRTSYQVPDAQIGEAGRRVKCIKCEHVWHAMLDPEPVLAAATADQPSVSVSRPEDAAARPEVSRSPSSDEPTPVDDTPSMETPMPKAGPVDETATISGDLPEEASDIEAASEPELGEDDPSLADGTRSTAMTDGLSDESADIIANVSQAIIEIDNESAVEKASLKSPIVKTQIKVKKHTHARENCAGILAVAISAVLLISAVLFREPIVRAVPETARLYGMLGMPVNLRGLEFTNIATSTDFENGVPVLMVSGTIVNVSADPVELPVVRLALRTSQGQEVYAWSYEPSVKRLSVGEQVDFTTRVASPPDGASDIQLRFIGINRASTSGG